MVQFDVTQLAEIARSQPAFRGVKGSIVRLKINDFMTYHKVELRAGPNVNLILGPNGTGKSTIVCAICIGLAGKPKILGRASSLKEYIRHDCNSASIEIELYNPNGENYVVRRFIKATQTGASTTWALNGGRVQPAAIEKLLSELNIQLDNLCQFLPQDRVQEFSKMDAYSLLRSTQQAMGKDTLIDKHDRLIKLNEIVKQIDHTVENSASTLRAEQQYNQRLENEVKNYHEREKFKKQISSLKGKRAWIIYLKAVQSFSKVNTELETLKHKKKDEESKLLPMKKSVQQMESKLVRFRQEMNACRSQNVSVITAVKRKYEDECDKIEVRVNEINSELAAVEKSESDRQKRVEAATQKLNALTTELKKFDSEGHNKDMARLEEDVRTIGDEVTKFSESIYKITEENASDQLEIRGLNEKIRQWNSEIVKLGDLRVSRLKYMQREKRDAYHAVEFFSKPENLTKLKGKIHEPMILHICVNDLKYGPTVERHIGIADMTAFFCEDKDDLEVMLALMKTLGFRISIIHHEVPPKNWQKPKPSLNPEYLRRYSFQKTLIELIQAPEYYLSYMTKKHRVQDVPVGVTPDTDKKFKEITTQTQIQAFYTDENSYFIKKSAYGNGICSSVDFLPPARVFTTEINASERERLEDLVKTASAEKAKIENRMKGRSGELKMLEENRAAKETEHNQARAKVDYRRQIVYKITQARRGKEQLETDIPDLQDLRERAQKEIWEEREKLTTHLEWSVSEIEKNAHQGQKFIILKRQVSVLQSRIMTKQNLLEDLEASINQHNGGIRTLTEQVEARAAEAERAKREAVEVSQLSEAPSDVTGGNLTVDDISREITQAESQMGFLVDTDASIVKDYQERLKKIEKLTRERGVNLEKLTDIKKEIAQKKMEWLDPLQDLIQRINYNFGTFFANMGCAGEVSLCTGEDENDFAKYGIKIMVKFRNSEPLAEMCGTRVGTLQSGGERVITTALYVLALQELTVVPFRVIDEINQGMDAKNESRFFNLLCSMARGANTPQYFLLTPKMLPPVDYPDNVDFHFIMNGPKVNIPFDSGSDDGGSDDEEEQDEDMEEDDDSEDD